MAVDNIVRLNTIIFPPWTCSRFGMILPLFVPYYLEIPPVGGSTFGGISVSSKSMNYILGLQVIASSSANIVVGISGIVSSSLKQLELN